MAIPVEELAAGVVESMAGPWGVVVGLGALGMLALSRGRSASSRAGTASLEASPAPAARPGRLGRLRADWRSLVDEARREHAAGKARRLAIDVALSENGAATARGRDGRGSFTTRPSNGTSAT